LATNGPLGLTIEFGNEVWYVRDREQQHTIDVGFTGLC
jgi:hypothetical protein